MNMGTDDNAPDNIEIPWHFLCPISLELMTDPVIVSTGITYDRHSIDTWLSSSSSSSSSDTPMTLICPVTKLPISLSDDPMIPNHTLRRLIQSWCCLHSVDLIPTPTRPVDTVTFTDLPQILADARSSSRSRANFLRRLRSIKDGGDRYGWSDRRILVSPATVDFLTEIVVQGEGEALSLLSQIKLSAQQLKDILNNNHHHYRQNLDVSREFEFIDCLVSNFLSESNITSSPQADDQEEDSSQARTCAIRLLKSLYTVADPDKLAAARPELFAATVRTIYDDGLSPKATKWALKLLLKLTSSSSFARNRVKAVQAGAVSALVDTLLNRSSTSKRLCELTLAALDHITCGGGCAEGRAALVAHPAGIAVVSKKVLRVSVAASERAVKVLCSVGKANSKVVVGEMLEVGAVTKLCIVARLDYVGWKTKERAKEVLRMHSNLWRNSGCLPPQLVDCYPSWS